MESLFEKPVFKIIEENKKNNHGIFEVSNLVHGFGVTLGNSIRRVLISSIEGAAVVAIKINGIRHQFESIPGIKEDVLKIILNLKKLVLKINDKNLVNLTLNVNKKGEVKAADFSSVPGVEIISKDLVIATLVDDVEFNLEIMAINGRGYAHEKENKKYISVLDWIAIDSNFSPIEIVNFQVEEINTSQYELMEKLTIDIQTNGSIVPKIALEQSAQIMISYFLLLSDVSSIEEFETLIHEKPVEVENNKNLDLIIDDLDFSQRSSNALKKKGFKTLRDISKLDREKLNQIDNLGQKSVQEIIEKLKMYNINID